MGGNVPRLRLRIPSLRSLSAACLGAAVLSGCGLFRGKAEAVVIVDPRAADSFGSLCVDYPLPAEIDYRYITASSASEPADASLLFGDGPPGKDQKTVSEYRPYPVKYYWEEAPQEYRTLPLADIRLPRSIWTGSPGYAECSKGELILSVGKGAPKALREWFARVPQKEGPSIAWLAAVGDLMLGRGIEDILLSGPEGVDRVFGDALPVLRKADFLVGNLEGALTLGGTAAAKLYVFRFSPETAGKLKEAGFDFLSMSNNHSLDYGQGAFLDGLSRLRSIGMGCSGAGKDSSEASTPFRAEAGGQAFSLVAFGAYRPELPLASLMAAPKRPGILMEKEGIAAIRGSSGEGVIDVAVVHAGTEYADRPDDSTRRLFRECVDSGADIVLGSHPHVLQGVETYRGRLIAYSLGNFVFRGMEGQPNATDTMILFIGLLDGRVVAVDPVFARIGADGPRLAPKAAGKRFYALSRALATTAGQEIPPESKPVSAFRP